MSVRVISTPLEGTPLTQAGIAGKASDWYVARPTSGAEWKQRADEMRSALVSDDWLAALAPALDATSLAASRLERAAESGFAVTTGQQPGLFGGPLYTWWKALSALALANHLEKLAGIPVVPIFWAATDDSDFLEAADTTVALNDRSVTIALPLGASDGNALSRRPLGDVTAQLEQLTMAAGSAASARILEDVRAAYASNQTIGGAYVALLRAVLNPLGIAVIDASHKATRAAALPVLITALRRATEVDAALLNRSTELKAAGHAPQVKLVKARSLVFADKSGRRERVSVIEAGQVADSAASAELGANVLLRPIVERSIIPTVAYVGGPAEIAYFAQVSAVAAALGTPAPLVVPRWSGIVVEPRIDRILEKHKLGIAELRDPHAAETRIARASLPAELQTRIENVRESIQKTTAALATAEGADLVPSKVIEGLKGSLARRLDRLERRYSAAVKRRGNDALSDVASARASLFPRNVPQERALNVVPLLARHGDTLFSDVMREVEPHVAALT